MDVRARINDILGRFSLGLKSLADQTGVQYRTIQRYASGERPPSAEFLTALIENLGISATWLLTGKGNMLIEAEQSHHLAEGFAAIPVLFDGKANPKDTASTYPISKTWLECRNLEAASLRFVNVKGDSMAPELSEGDWALVDENCTSIVDGHMYAVRYSGGLFLKRFQVRPEGQLRLSSSNPFYDPIDVPFASGFDLEIMGQVVALIRFT